MGVIRITNMPFHTYNGVLPEEQRLGQRIEVDVALTFPIETQVVNDDLVTTINYAAVYDEIQAFVGNHQYKLIESLANQLAQTLLAQFPAMAVTLTIRKYAVPIAGVFDHVAIEVTHHA